eukprot:scaffold86902_cov17-Tisochrysis_lutea.AAC.1
MPHGRREHLRVQPRHPQGHMIASLHMQAQRAEQQKQQGKHVWSGTDGQGTISVPSVVYTTSIYGNVYTT